MELLICILLTVSGWRGINKFLIANLPTVHISIVNHYLMHCNTGCKDIFYVFGYLFLLRNKNTTITIIPNEGTFSKTVACDVPNRIGNA